MAVVRGPLFSVEARGTVFNCVVFFRKPGRSIVRGQMYQSDPNTAAQAPCRQDWRDAVSAWQTAYEGIRDAWRAEATPPLSGFNYFCQQYIEQGGFPSIP